MAAEMLVYNGSASLRYFIRVSLMTVVMKSLTPRLVDWKRAQSNLRSDYLVLERERS